MALGTVLNQHGLSEEAAAQFQLVLRTAPFESWEWQAAVHSLAQRARDAREKDAAEAAALFAQSLLDDLRTNFHLVHDRDYLVTPSMIHRLRAAAEMDAGRFEAAEKHVQQALVALPGETDLSEELVPRLEKAGRQQQADQLFAKVFGVYAEGVQAYPECALLHNNLAWTAARCGRRLDEAQQHAERAVELDPDNASYLDTLAEAYFQRGDRESALRHSRRAAELRPGDETLQRQLKRFERDPLPSR
jgi:tetratricopeptide (TPR) repeat protein